MTANAEGNEPLPDITEVVGVIVPPPDDVQDRLQARHCSVCLNNSSGLEIHSSQSWGSEGYQVCTASGRRIPDSELCLGQVGGGWDRWIEGEVAIGEL